MYPIASEKAIGMIEKNNAITYIVDFRATKKEIADEFSSKFNVKIKKVNVHITHQNTKKAFIYLNKESKASDIALKLKLV